TYEYPFIKWAGRPVYGNIKADAWLDTTYEGGYLKYVLTVQFEKGILKAGEGSRVAQKRGLVVELLDQDGFKIAQFNVPGYQLSDTRSESVLEARNSVLFPEAVYKRAQRIIIR
ncbi:MAG: hypothetical protein ACRD3W_18180, partial [Terriglobales bacterium]